MENISQDNYCGYELHIYSNSSGMHTLVNTFMQKNLFNPKVIRNTGWYMETNFFRVLLRSDSVVVDVVFYKDVAWRLAIHS